jgi:hypothetical protein
MQTLMPIHQRKNNASQQSKTTGQMLKNKIKEVLLLLHAMQVTPL